MGHTILYYYTRIMIITYLFTVPFNVCFIMHDLLLITLRRPHFSGQVAVSAIYFHS